MMYFNFVVAVLLFLQLCWLIVLGTASWPILAVNTILMIANAAAALYGLYKRDN